MGERPTVCVIGAGISGLTSSKMLKDYGIPFDTFEAGDRVGGNWAFKNSNGHSSAYRSLHIDTSKNRISFKDFQMPEDGPVFPHHTDIQTYLERYVDTFGLRSKINFETPVEHAERLPGGGYEVTVKGETRRYDALVVANGHHWNPRYPDFPGTFDGPSIHSHHYIDPADPLELRGKRVLVVGIGNSASDVASELGVKSNAAKVFISTRSGAYVMPKQIFGLPVDEIVKTVPQIPLGLQRKIGQFLPKLLVGDMESYGLPKPNHKFLESHPTVSSELLLRMSSGDVVGKPNVTELLGDRVRFEDGSIEEVDAIIYATGYHITFPFFAEDFVSAPDNRIDLYKRMFKPGLDDVVFVGFAQPIPTLFPFVECQARTMARYIAGRYRPPAPDVMQATIAADQQLYTGHYYVTARHTQQSDYYVYEHDMRVKELPAGRKRVDELGPVALAGRAGAVAAHA